MKKTRRTEEGTLERILDWLEPFIIFFLGVLIAIITFPFKFLKRCFKFARRHWVLSCVALIIGLALFVLVADSCSDASLVANAASYEDFIQPEYHKELISSGFSAESEASNNAETLFASDTAKMIPDTQSDSKDVTSTEDCGESTKQTTAPETVTTEENSEVETLTPDNQSSSPYILASSENQETVNDSVDAGEAPLVSDDPTVVVLDGSSIGFESSEDTSTSASTEFENTEVLDNTPEDNTITEETEESEVLVETETVDVSTAVSTAVVADEEASDEVTESSDSDWTNDEISRIAADMGYYSDLAPIAIAGMKVLVNEYGYTREGAAGLIGNTYAEATYFVGADNGAHFGIFQWDYDDRWPKIASYLEEVGCIRTSRHDDYSSLSLEEQIDVFRWQLRASQDSTDAQNYQETISFCRSTYDAQESANQWRIYYEGCGDQAAQARRDAAVRVLNLYNALYSF